MYKEPVYSFQNGNIQHTKITSERNVQGIDITSEKNVHGLTLRVRGMYMDRHQKWEERTGTDITIRCESKLTSGYTKTLVNDTSALRQSDNVDYRAAYFTVKNLWKKFGFSFALSVFIIFVKRKLFPHTKQNYLKSLF